MLIRPYSDSSLFAANNPCDATTANFPAVKHFWKCAETSGTTLTDVMRGLVLSGADTMTFGTNYVVPNRTSSAQATKTGTIVAPNGKPFLFMSVIAGTTSGFSVGDTVNGPCLALAQPAASPILNSNAGIYPGTAYTNGGATIYGRGLYVSDYNNASGMQTLECTATSTYSAKAATTTANTTPSTAEALSVSNLSTLEGATGKWACGANVTALYGAALIVFSATPTALFLQSIMTWHTYQWANGNKRLYPGLRGVA